MYIDLHFIVHSVPDLPISNGTIKRECDEEGSVALSLTRLFYDVDTAQGVGLSYVYNDTGQTDVAVTLDEMTGDLELVPGTDVFGDFTFEFFCQDDQGIDIPGIVELTVHGVNDIPRILLEIPVIYMQEGGDEVEIDMSEYFHDVDWDALRYTFNVPSEYSADMNVYHKNHVVTESTIIIELTDEHFYAFVVIPITCHDAEDTTVKQDLRISIVNVPNPPIVEYTPMGNPGAMDEGDSRNFEITDILDPDLLEFGQHTYTWTVDGEVLADHNVSTYTFTAGYDDAGPHTVMVVVTDPAGLTAQVDPTWAFLVNDVNREPTVSLPPDLPTKIKETDRLSIDLLVDDPDEDSLNIYWYRLGEHEDKLLGTGTSLSFKLPAGRQTVEIVVDDGKGEDVRTSFIVTVEEVEEAGSGTMALILIILFVVIMAAVGAVAVMQRKKEAVVETKMDLESLQTGYDPTQGREGGAGEAYDPTPRYDEEYEKLK
jgi:hypothetical protein